MANAKLIQEINSYLEHITTERLEKIREYALSLLHVNDEILNLKEEQSIEILGYNPTEHIDDWEWEQMLKRDQMSQERLKNKEEK
jgi:hypothetical protein